MTAPTAEMPRHPLPGHPGYYLSDASRDEQDHLSATLYSPEAEPLFTIEGPRFWTEQDGPGTGLYAIARALIEFEGSPLLGVSE